jgi:hypothetical protein
MGEHFVVVSGEPQAGKVQPWGPAELVAMLEDDGRYDDDPSPCGGTYSED